VAGDPKSAALSLAVKISGHNNAKSFTAYEDPYTKEFRLGNFP